MVRKDAYYLLDSAPFPPEERLAFVRLGLRDSNERVRYWSAICFASAGMSDKDWQLLKNASRLEKDKDTREKMHEILKDREIQRARKATKQKKAAGAGQPATKPAYKPPVKDQPSPPTSKDSPR